LHIENKNITFDLEQESKENFDLKRQNSEFNINAKNQIINWTHDSFSFKTVFIGVLSK
jgi:hypothetical protein